ncbi:MAG: PIG-L deacetylase family protein [Candidatus Hodarchaeota archaeon]
MKRVLIVAAHPDDEILGCGGTIAKLLKEGDEGYTLILGEGITSRDDSRDAEKRKGEIEKLKKSAMRANKILGIKEVFFCDLPDNRFDTIPLLDIIKIVENFKKRIEPNVIFTHFSSDLNIDHRITHDAVLTATRPLPSESVKEIYSFEILSSTEWRFPQKFSPNVFYNIESTINLKIDAMKEYSLELAEYPHPRSLDGIRINAKSWGMKVGIKYCEPFTLIRKIN